MPSEQTETRAELKEQLRRAEGALWAAVADSRDWALRDGAKVQRIAELEAERVKLAKLRDEGPDKEARFRKLIADLQAKLEALDAPKVRIGRRALEAAALHGLGSQDKRLQDRGMELLQRLVRGADAEVLWDEYVDLRS